MHKAAFDLRTSGRHSGQAREHAVEVEVLFPRFQSWGQRRRIADELATQIHALVADVNPWTTDDLRNCVARFQAERAGGDGDGHRGTLCGEGCQGIPYVVRYYLTT